VVAVAAGHGAASSFSRIPDNYETSKRCSARWKLPVRSSPAVCCHVTNAVWGAATHRVRVCCAAVGGDARRPPAAAAARL
jgi:hypothetical protein